MRCLPLVLCVVVAEAALALPVAPRHGSAADPRLAGNAPLVGDHREVVNFDFSWRHHLGNATPPLPSNCSNGTKGLNYGVDGSPQANVDSPAACCALCTAQSGCQCWDYNVDTSDPNYKTCWTKTDGCDKSVENPLRYSGQMIAPPRPGPPPEAGPAFNDSAWELVDAPHDMLIVQPYDRSNSQSMAFLARNVGWYRKHFFLPQEWANSSVWLYIEGSFHVTTIWVNGVEVTTHVQGCTYVRSCVPAYTCPPSIARASTPINVLID
jgi:hypothetical protein